jgi:hypothetical protein
MRLRLIMVLLSSSADIAFAAPAAPQPCTPWTHTRPLSPGAIALLEEAAERSTIVTSLLEDLEQADVLVYVTGSMPGAVGGPTSHMVFLSRDETTRYLLVRIDFLRLTPPERIVSLGHELHHALEVANAPEVTDSGGLAQLYRRIGWENEKNRFETAGARITGNRVRSQLNGRANSSRRASSERKVS